MSKTRFRAALVLSYAIGLISVAASFAAESGMPAPLRDYLEQERNVEFSAGDGVLIAVGLPLVIVSLVSFVAMLRFWRWSRELAIGSYILGLALLPLAGPTVEPGISTALNYVSSMLYGAVIALAYYSPAAEWFQSQRLAEPPPYPMGGAAMGGMS